MFKRDSIDVIDLTDLHKRKLIKLTEKAEEKVKVTNDGFFDFSQNQINKEIENQTKQEIEAKPETQVTSFLSDFASIGASNPSPEVSQTNNQESESIKDLKWRIENLEYKIEELTNRLNSNNKS